MRDKQERDERWQRFLDQAHLKILTIEQYEPIDKTRISEAHYIDEHPHWDWVGFEPGDDSGTCWICGNYKEWLVRFVDINDGCINEFICAECVDKLKIVLDELRSSTSTWGEVK